ncbi:MAG: GNAT family N-acetyltransferase [Oxalobacteraceae bacterium]|nr:MAG: GNAT family N-acetyltransferase [Oxalobacteraceae bacterium]
MRADGELHICGQEKSMSAIASSICKDAVSVSCFLDEIPEWIEAALEKRYASLHASLPYLRIHRPLHNIGCYVATLDDIPLEILLFRLERRQIVVLNEMFDFAPGEAARFVDFVFASFANIDVLSFSAVNADCDGLRRPLQRYPSKHTFVVSLPGTPEDYLARIGKTTRASIRQHLNTVRRVFPSLTWRCLVKDEIDTGTLRAIVELSERRINAKGVRLRHDIDRIAALSKECGFVVVLLIDGRLCAGSINYRVGSDFFGDVTCYDPEFHRYGLGKLCTYQTVCESILRGGRQFHFGGGEFDFKERMLGKRVDMDQLHVYRSYPKVLANFTWAARVFVRGQLGRYRTRLHARKDSLQSRVVLGLLQAYRNRTAK